MEFPDFRVVAFDNLRRRGSELAISRLGQRGVEFVHGDVRQRGDLLAVGRVSVIVECSAEPSVHAGYGSAPGYVIDTNFSGAYQCLELLREQGDGRLVFLSSSRVYPIAGLCGLPLEISGSRFVIPAGMEGTGWSVHGIDHRFPMGGSRSVYGWSKYAAELLIEEYISMYQLSATVLRLGVIAGPWQMGKVDQGFVSLWLARHVFGGRLGYLGFGGKGLQVRDVLHVDDLCDLVILLLSSPQQTSLPVLNVGGGASNAVSLQELTGIAQRLTGQNILITEDTCTRPADIPYYVSDNREITRATGWVPSRSVEVLSEDVLKWLIDQRALLEPILMG
jgi:CDP-paratose 2-epimerase